MTTDVREEETTMERERSTYESPQLEDLGQIHEVTRDHKTPAPGDQPHGGPPGHHEGGFGS